jgi:acetyl esterase/lipase
MDLLIYQQLIIPRIRINGLCVFRNIFILLLVSLPPLLAMANPTKKDNYQLIANVLYRESATADSYVLERCRLDLYYPVDAKDFKTVVWFHGGGLRAGNKFVPEQLQERGFAVVAVNYRLFPEVKSPTYIDDAAAAVAWVFHNITKYGGDKSKIFVSGHSAGGNLASMIGLDRSYLRRYDAQADSIAALIPFSGHAITHFTVRAERGIEGTEVVVDGLAPISHIRKDAPPLVLITGDREMEMLGRYEENAYLYRMMRVIGHEQTTLYELEGFNHGEMANPAFYILRDYVKEH